MDSDACLRQRGTDARPDSLYSILPLRADRFTASFFSKGCYFVRFLIVSTTDVRFCRLACLTDLNFPVMALRPTLKVFPRPLGILNHPLLFNPTPPCL
jgi:hypothetical protein